MYNNNMKHIKYGETKATAAGADVEKLTIFW